MILVWKMRYISIMVAIMVKMSKYDFFSNFETKKLFSVSGKNFDDDPRL